MNAILRSILKSVFNLDRLQVLALYGLFAAGALSILYVIFSASVHVNGQSVNAGSSQANATGIENVYLDGFSFWPEPRPVTDLDFKDAAGRTLHLSDFKGKVALINIWSTRCVPCVLEMPSLDQLQQEFSFKSFEVVAVSVDYHGIEAITEFYQANNIKHLQIYSDRTSRISRELGEGLMPTSILLDANGMELGRIEGPAEWNSEPAKHLIQTALQSND